MKKLLFLLLGYSVISVTAEFSFAQGLVKTAGTVVIGGGAITRDIIETAVLRSGVQGGILSSQILPTNRLQPGQAPRLSQSSSFSPLQNLVTMGMYQIIVSNTGEILNAPGAQTAEEAKEMGTLLNALNHYTQFHNRGTTRDIEEAVSFVRQTASLLNTGSRNELRGHFERKRDRWLEQEQDFQDRFNRVKTSIEAGQSLPEVQEIFNTHFIPLATKW